MIEQEGETFIDERTKKEQYSRNTSFTSIAAWNFTRYQRNEITSE